MDVCGIVLAGGEGTRFGGPKALARTADGTPWLHRVVAALRAGGCGRVLVALGAAADEARELVPDGAEAIVVDDWTLGLAATLRAALAAVEGADAAVIAPVDVPDLPASAVARLVALAAPSGLAQAVYEGRPGHPALIGADHIAAVRASATGDRGARLYLRTHAAAEIECSDLWHGQDQDTPPPSLSPSPSSHQD
ncbi:MAG: NTP transferase domain-containing protein [Microbacterium sp.]